MKINAAALLCFVAAFAEPAFANEVLALDPTKLTRSDLTENDRLRVAKVTAAPTDFSKPQPFEAKSGGAATTTALVNRDVFSHFSPNITFEQEQEFKLGNALFRKLWVSSPSSTQASDGLGPLFNARACQSCHIKDGRGHPPEGDADATSMFLRLARAPLTEAEHQQIANGIVPNFPDPFYGGQLQDLALPGLKGEGQMVITYVEEPVTLGDGEVISLRRPSYSVKDLGYGPLNPSTTLSPRIAPPMTGLGLIEAIHEAEIAAKHDPEDINADGVSGKMALIRNSKTNQVDLGRFGWKAENVSVRAQSASAFAGDIGISSPDVPLHYGDCTTSQTDCLAAVTGVQERLGNTEAPDPVLDLVTFYSKNLAVPQRRNVGAPNVLKGKEQFYALGCASCHTPAFVTRRDADNKEHKFQLIWPYSDFLLHDMGEGLADGQQVGLASGQEWKTPPLWGIGLTQTVSGHTFFLHDGRARNLTEAILWHGGEAQKARDAFAASIESDREALLAFLESL